MVDQPKRRRALRRFQSRQRHPRRTSGVCHHQKASLVRRLNKIWMFDRTLMHQNNSGSWGRRCRTSPERARVPPVAIDNRNPQDQELPQVARGALSEQNELADAARASVSAQSSSNRSGASQNDNSTVAASAADDNTKIEPAAQAPSSAPIQQDRPAAAESSARGSGEQQQSTENLNTNKLSVAKHISIHYRRDSAPGARGCAAPCQLAGILRLRDAPPADDGTRRRVTRRPLFLQGRR